ncbi:MAG: hypothetical protein ACOYJU_00120 [Anaerovoracaceae bacterium]
MVKKEKKLQDYREKFAAKGMGIDILYQLLDVFLEELDHVPRRDQSLLPGEESGLLDDFITKMKAQVVEENIVKPAYAPHRKGGAGYALTIRVLELYRDFAFFRLQQNADYTVADYEEWVQKRLVSYTPLGDHIYEFPSLCQILDMSLNDPWGKSPLLNYLGSNQSTYSSVLEYMVRAALECLGKSSQMGKKRKAIIEYLYIDPLQAHTDEEHPWQKFGMKRSAYYYNHQKAIEYISMKLFGPYGERLQKKQDKGNKLSDDLFR